MKYIPPLSSGNVWINNRLTLIMKWKTCFSIYLDSRSNRLSQATVKAQRRTGFDRSVCGGTVLAITKYLCLHVLGGIGSRPFKFMSTYHLTVTGEQLLETGCLEVGCLVTEKIHPPHHGCSDCEQLHGAPGKGFILSGLLSCQCKSQIWNPSSGLKPNPSLASVRSWA